jgi:peptidoglycan hydrolase-like protein with peptidoglycan-binding domain
VVAVLALASSCGQAARVSDSAPSTVFVTRQPVTTAPDTAATPTSSSGPAAESTTSARHRPPRATVTVEATPPTVVVTVTPPEPSGATDDGTGPPWPGTSLTTSLRSAYRSDVVEVQRRLNALGYGPLAVDGHYGPVTAGVVRQYQSDYGLVVDGVVGPQTWRSLFEFCYCD